MAAAGQVSKTAISFRHGGRRVQIRISMVTPILDRRESIPTQLQGLLLLHPQNPRKQLQAVRLEGSFALNQSALSPYSNVRGKKHTFSSINAPTFFRRRSFGHGPSGCLTLKTVTSTNPAASKSCFSVSPVWAGRPIFASAVTCRSRFFLQALSSAMVPSSQWTTPPSS